MQNKQSGSSALVFLPALAAIACVIVLLASPGTIPWEWHTPAWIVSILAAALAGVMWLINRAKDKAAAQEKAEKDRIRAQKRLQERAEQEAKKEAMRLRAEEKEAEMAAQRAAARVEASQKNMEIWKQRVDHAASREAVARAVIEKSTITTIRDAAGKAVAEWSAALLLAQRTLREIEVLAARPEVQADARAEARAAIQEAARIKERGDAWTKEKAEALAAVRERAKAEAQAEETRREQERDIAERAEAEWRIAEIRATRAEDDLKALATKR